MVGVVKHLILRGRLPDGQILILAINLSHHLLCEVEDARVGTLRYTIFQFEGKVLELMREDEVATIGSVSPEQIDYLMDRGLSRREAEQLFVRAIFEDAIMHAPEEASHRAAVLRAEEVLGADVAHDFDEGAGLPEGGEAAC